jgi:gluconate 2-dehydrogenase alpha chain
MIPRSASVARSATDYYAWCRCSGWAGITFRFQPEEFRLKSHLTERYGASAIPDELVLIRYGTGTVTLGQMAFQAEFFRLEAKGDASPVVATSWEEMEPHYMQFERVAGTSGRAGNLNGEKRPGGNV